MKDISFDEVKAFNFPHTCSCLLFADFDEDGFVELIVGSREGYLSVFKTNFPPDVSSKLMNYSYQYVSCHNLNGN